MENLGSKMKVIGYTAKTLSKLFNVSYGSVSSHFNGNRISTIHKNTYTYFLECRDKSFGQLTKDKLSALLVKHGLTPTKLAKALDYNQSSVVNHCNGNEQIGKFHNAMYWYFFRFLDEGGDIDKKVIMSEDKCIEFLKATGNYEIFKIVKTKM